MKTNDSKESETKRNILSFTLKVMLLVAMVPSAVQLSAGPRMESSPEPQNQVMIVKGKVVDKSGYPLPGVVVKVKGTSQGTTTDLDGKFSIYAPREKAVLQFLYLSYKTVEITPDFSEEMVVVMEDDSEQIEQAVVVGYGKQSRLTITGALSTVKPEVVVRAATPSLSNSLAGQLPGVITRQASGEPGADAAQVYIRGLATWGSQSPLILVDGIERDLNMVNSQEVESLTVLKDASATAVYGARGANGVILITTKRGQTGRPEIIFRTESACLTALRRPQYINGYEYASLMNEALRFNNQAPRWSQKELLKYRAQSDPYLYPSVDWSNEVLKEHTYQSINNLSVTGGSDIIKYYLNVGYTFQNGLWKRDPSNTYNTNSNYQKYTFRNNTDINLSKNLVMSLGLGAILAKGNHPGASSGAIINALNTISPIAYPKYNPDGTLGGSQAYVGSNPWGLATQSGYSTDDNSSLQASFGLNYKMDFITEGLSARALFSYDRNANVSNARPKAFLVKRYLGKDPETGEDLYSAIFREEQPMGYSVGSSSDRAQYFEAQINYERSFGEHNVTAMALFNQREYIALTAGDSRSNIPYRRVGFAGRVTYNYAGRYLVEGNFGYNGSENFARGHRFGFFPSASLGWFVSEEDFFDIFKPVISRMKVRLSHGLVGNDQLGIRFGYMSTINTAGQAYYFGTDQKYYAGMEENATGNENITWETSKKTDLGLDLGFFDDIVTMQLDFFKEHRSDILIQRKTIPQATGIFPWSIPYGNIGIVKNHGFDGLLEGRVPFSRDVYMTLRGNFTYAHNTVIENDEPKPKYPYLSAKGKRLGQYFGFVSDGFFKDAADIAASPLHTMGNVRPGDAKYVDINGDGRVDSYDQVAMGYARTPEISFGFGGTLAIHSFDISIFFNGAARTSILTSGLGLFPFYDGLGGNNVMREYYNNRWTPETPDAKYPAVDVGANPNNFVASDIWLKNGNYLRLRNAEIGYTVPMKSVDRGVEALRIFLNGMNLYTWDHVKFMDPESNDGTGAYPLQRSVNLGLQIKFK